MKQAFKLLICILIPLTAGFLAGFFTTSEIPGWYQSIQKPSWNPPNWVFAPVWTFLYVTMGISLFLVWKSGAPEKVKKRAYGIFAVQLVFNFFWSFIFFKQHQTGWALAEIILLWLMILLTILTFARVSKPAAWLLVPYISWVSFAVLLNYTIWKIN